MRSLNILMNQGLSLVFHLISDYLKQARSLLTKASVTESFVSLSIHPIFEIQIGD
ncbi:hypothetical protein [Paucibacter sp. TC2R-5]|uniref:hypothetical protein n=1 Tax=Paucibacter sp. TC2R-5 TaxID=2893555 RepID=UPI0021E4E26E|nr:hypothetical protein [Paucibacter sp. TC2R-5]